MATYQTKETPIKQVKNNESSTKKSQFDYGKLQHQNRPPETERQFLDKHQGQDLLFADGNDDYQVDWYIVNGGSATYIGYEFVEEGVLNFSDTKFT